MSDIPNGMRTADEETLLDFVLWELRHQDLPEPIREAALRVSETRRRPARVHRYTEGPLLVDGFPADDNAPLQRLRSFPHQVGQNVRHLLDNGCQYILVQDL